MSIEELELLIRDAKRYRWLRSQHWMMQTVVVTNAKSVQRGTQTYSGEFLDEKIDQAAGLNGSPRS